MRAGQGRGKLRGSCYACRSGKCGAAVAPLCPTLQNSNTGEFPSPFAILGDHHQTARGSPVNLQVTHVDIYFNMYVFSCRFSHIYSRMYSYIFSYIYLTKADPSVQSQHCYSKQPCLHACVQCAHIQACTHAGQGGVGVRHRFLLAHESQNIDLHPRHMLYIGGSLIGKTFVSLRGTWFNNGEHSAFLGKFVKEQRFNKCEMGDVVHARTTNWTCWRGAPAASMPSTPRLNMP